MSAPERIWIDEHGGNWSPVSGGTQRHQYVRADLVDGVENEWRGDWEREKARADKAEADLASMSELLKAMAEKASQTP